MDKKKSAYTYKVSIYDANGSLDKRWFVYYIDPITDPPKRVRVYGSLRSIFFQVKAFECFLSHISPIKAGKYDFFILRRILVEQNDRFPHLKYRYRIVVYFDNMITFVAL